MIQKLCGHKQHEAESITHTCIAGRGKEISKNAMPNVPGTKNHETNQRKKVHKKQKNREKTRLRKMTKKRQKTHTRKTKKKAGFKEKNKSAKSSTRKWEEQIENLG